MNPFSTRLLGIFTLTVLLGTGAYPSALAQSPQGSSVLITNVRLWDGKSSGLPEIISILVLEGVIQQISVQSIPPVGGTMHIDGGGGIVMGIVEEGTRANLLLFDSSPLEDIAILAEAPSHTALLMKDGLVAKNTLTETTATPVALVEETPTQVASEEAPPAIPGAWKRFDSRWVNFEPAGAVVMDFVRFGQGDRSREQIGDLEEFEVPDIRALRAGVLGTVNFKKPWRWLVAGAYGGFLAGFERGVTPT